MLGADAYLAPSLDPSVFPAMVPTVRLFRVHLSLARFLQGNQPYTMACWAKFDTTAPLNQFIVMFGWGGNVNNQFNALQRTNTNGISNTGWANDIAGNNGVPSDTTQYVGVCSVCLTQVRFRVDGIIMRRPTTACLERFTLTASSPQP